ncbi:MAG TPA: Stp1/IreP family PP2C-type Ser/Thr phosphatase [Acidobacteriaceae bacterium]|jgi:protein phosphatase|nr:Stp1/IreP family PP2C-type Ser/Thr phosphatase [Acidobacteriaceae bacterium]
MMAKNSRLPKAVARTSTGRVRTGNEDAFGFLPDHGVYVVCDGMGGAAGGEIASRLAVDTVLHRIAEGNGAGGSARDRIHEAIAEANRTVLERADEEPGLYGMGTTLVALMVGHPEPGKVLIAHAGDSRCYLFRNGNLSLCTHDHSLVDEQMRLGTMTREEAERSPFRSVITRAIGTQETVTEEILEMDTEPGDLFLLCTDGLTREVPEEEIARVLGARKDLEHAVERLVEEANEAGGRDNVTCVLVPVPGAE